MSGPDGGGDKASSSAPRRRRRPEPSPIQRALGLLTRREHSRKELLHKLAARGVEAEAAQAAVGKLAEAGWQDDVRFAEALLRTRSQAGYGPVWIKAELGTHALGEAVVATALEECGLDWAEVAASLLRRRFGAEGPSGLEQRRKAMDLLLRRGFGYEHAQAALAQLGDEADGAGEGTADA